MSLKVPSREMALLISGASGSRLPACLAPMLLKHGKLDVLHLVMTRAALKVAEHELGGQWSTAGDFVDQLGLSAHDRNRILIWDEEDLAAPIASGSHLLNGVIILPCSAGMAGSLAHGISRGLVQRAGDVALKQKWPLILGIRETPMSEILLENLLRLSRAGAVILPPVPAFYLPQDNMDSMEVFLRAYCLRLLDTLGIHLPETHLRWKN